MIEVLAGSCTHVGHVREVNEDGCLVAFGAYAVADGMGGHNRGDVASALLIDELAAGVQEQPLEAERLSDAVQRAHENIVRAAPPGQTMGTTLAGVFLIGDLADPRWLIVNVGDSRVYRLAGGDLQLVSKDHSLVQELVDSGDISADQARLHPRRNVVTRAVGIGHPLVPDYWFLEPAPGERFIICSDGVHGELEDNEIRRLVLAADEPSVAAVRIIEAVLAGAARDNATVVVVETKRHAPIDATDDTAPRDAIQVPADLEANGRPVDEATEQVLELIAAPSSLAPNDEGMEPGLGEPVDLGEAPEQVIEVPKW